VERSPRHIIPQPLAAMLYNKVEENLEMEHIIRLKDVIQEMDLVGDEYRAFLNIRTGELVTLSDEELSAGEEGKSLEDFPEFTNIQ
jgi:hypothetical protein